MTSVSDILNKSKSDKKFTPKQRRSWDYVNNDSSIPSPDEKQNTETGYKNGVQKGSTRTEYKNRVHKGSTERGYRKGVQKGGTRTRYIKRVQERSTRTGYKNRVQEQGTEIEYKKGVQKESTTGYRNGVQKRGTDQNRVQKRGTETGYSSKKNQTNTAGDMSADFSYQHGYKTLSGIPKKMVTVIFDLCEKQGKEKTQPITLSNLAMLCNTSKNTTKVTRKRLTDSGHILTEKSDMQPKTGRASSLVYSLSKNLFSEIKNEVNGVQKRGTETGYNDAYSSSIYEITTTNTEDENKNNQWKTINIEPLHDIGFSQNHLKQLSSKQLNTPEVIQESINHFAYGLKYNKQEFKTSPLNVLMGVLRKGEAWIEQGYRSPQEIAQEQLLSQRQAEKERLKKLHEDAYKLAVEDWIDTLSDKEKEKIAPMTEHGRKILMPQQVRLSLYFKDNLWEKRKKQYLAE